VQALLNTLDGDPNVNVRLAAAEALFSFRRVAAARQGLLRSLQEQDSPLVQLALIDYVVRLDEPESPQVIRKFLRKPLVNPAVSKEAEKSLGQLGKL
jgi:HEAT repeat protein